FVFNSYYESVGERVIRVDRGNLSRPTVEQVYDYRRHIDNAMRQFLAQTEVTQELQKLIILGINHEQQHQELLLSDIKYILGNNPLFPVYDKKRPDLKTANKTQTIAYQEGIYEIGFQGNRFCFDNETSRHKVYLNGFTISPTLVSNSEYLEFMNAG